MKTRKQLVFDLLSDHRWHSTAQICAIDVGGTEGTRRLRDLRADGLEIEQRRREGSSQFEYRLKPPPRPRPAPTEQRQLFA